MKLHCMILKSEMSGNDSLVSKLTAEARQGGGSVPKLPVYDQDRRTGMEPEGLKFAD